MLKALEQYYNTRCDGTWEHDYGFILETCDNPGWMLTIRDPDLCHRFCSLILTEQIPDAVKILIGDEALSEVILFSPQLRDLSDFVLSVLDGAGAPGTEGRADSLASVRQRRPARRRADVQTSEESHRSLKKASPAST